MIPPRSSLFPWKVTLIPVKRSPLPWKVTLIHQEGSLLPWETLLPWRRIPMSSRETLLPWRRTLLCFGWMLPFLRDRTVALLKVDIHRYLEGGQRSPIGHCSSRRRSVLLWRRTLPLRSSILPPSTFPPPGLVKDTASVKEDTAPTEEATAPPPPIPRRLWPPICTVWTEKPSPICGLGQ